MKALWVQTSMKIMPWCVKLKVQGAKKGVKQKKGADGPLVKNTGTSLFLTYILFIFIIQD